MRVKVAFVLPSFAGGGAERVMITLINRLDRRIISPALIVLDGSGSLRFSVAKGGAVAVLDTKRLRHCLVPLRRILTNMIPDMYRTLRMFWQNRHGKTIRGDGILSKALPLVDRSSHAVNTTVLSKMM